jgi:diguanylate cyclase (GGDEF)-like protein/PAS domain S-box-containing protein
MWQKTPYTWTLIFTAVFMLIPPVYIALKGRKIQGKRSFIIMMIAIMVWLVCYAFELASAHLVDKLFWSKMKYFGIVTIPVAWLTFTIAYVGKERWLTRRNLALLCLIPVLTLIFAWTNAYHGLFYKKVWLDTSGPFAMKASIHGTGFWINCLYAYLLLISGTVLTFRAFLHSPRLYRAQTTLILIAALFPFLANIFYTTGLNPYPWLDLSPFAFTLTGAMLSLAIIRYQLFDIIPVAHDVIIENMEDAMIVQDESLRIVAINPAALKLIGCTASEVIGKTVGKLFTNRPDIIDRYLEITEAHEEIHLNIDGTPQYFDLKISPLFTRQHRLQGRIIVLHNITYRKESEEQFKLLSMTDPLTSLYNVRHFYAQLETEIAMAKRHKIPLSLILLDIDNFKCFNDRWGHVEGDKVLANMGELLRESLRKSDDAFRYGGEEFTVILRSTPWQDALTVAEKIRSRLVEEAFCVPDGQTMHISVSIGVAQLQEDEDLGSFMERADKNMYMAKRGGKNRVFFSHDGQEEPGVMTPPSRGSIFHE